MTESKKNKKATIKKSRTKKTNTKKSSVKKTNTKKAGARKTSVKKEKISNSKKKSITKNEIVEDKRDNHLVLNSVTIINEIKLLHADLLKLSSSNEMVTLDASNVEMIDTAAMQLLVTFATTMKNKDVKVEWKNPSEVFLERVSTLGLNETLNPSEANA